MFSLFKGKKPIPLLEEFEQARKDYGAAQLMLNFADSDFVDHAVHRVNTSQSQLNALIRVAKKQGLQAWTHPLRPLATEAVEDEAKKTESGKAETSG